MLWSNKAIFAGGQSVIWTILKTDRKTSIEDSFLLATAMNPMITTLSSTINPILLKIKVTAAFSGLSTARAIPTEMQANTSAAKTPFKMAKGTNDGFRSSSRFSEASAIIFAKLVNLMASIFVDTIILPSCSLEIELQNDCRRFPKFLGFSQNFWREIFQDFSSD